MRPNAQSVGMVACALVLVCGSILRTLSGPSTFQSIDRWGIDDAYISYRYAQNLAQGNGLVFNHGERVEGYSNFLYVLLMSAAFSVTGKNGIYVLSVALNLIFSILAFITFTSYLRRQLGDAPMVAGALLFALCLPLWLAVSSGMETCLVVFFYIAIWVTVERVVEDAGASRVVPLCVLMILSLLARADGFVVPGLVVVYLVLKRRFRPALTCAVVLAAGLGVYESWRYHYYHALLPNTYYVKITSSLWDRMHWAIRQLAEVAWFEGLLAYLMVFLFVIVGALKRISQGSSRLLDEVRFDILFVVGWTAYWIYIGGDYFIDRFLIILFPMGIFALLKYLKDLTNRKTVAFGLALLAALEAGPAFLGNMRLGFHFDTYDCWITLGRFLGQNYPGRTLAIEALGKVPFFSGLYTIDMLGLVDPVIAHGPMAAKYFDPGHSKFDPDYILSRKPDLIACGISVDGDLDYGLTRAKYEKAGYHLEYLLDTSRKHHDVSIIKVSGMDDSSVRQWFMEGYNYAILTSREMGNH